MTLIATFRARNNGILFCSGRKEDDGIFQPSVDKIYQIRELISCQVFIAGAGPSSVIKNTWAEIHESLKRTIDDERDLVTEHRSVIEASLKSIPKK